MFKRIIWLLPLITIFSVILASQPDYLVTIDRSELEESIKLQELDLSIYHISGGVLIAGVGDLDVLDEKEILYNLIDAAAWTQSYYLISDKTGSVIETKASWGKEIYRDVNIALLKTPQLSVDQITAIPYQITELFPIPLKHLFEKTYPSRTGLLPQRTEIDQLLTEISPDSLGYFVQTMEDFVTRYCFAPNRDQVANWIRGEFMRFGYTDVVIDSFYQNNVWHKNVVATLPGTVNPDQNVIIGGHHDSIIFSQYGNPMFIAPGADDNATGSSAALEIARAMQAVNFQPETTIKFVTFAAEEVGLWGSHHFAQSALDNNMNIKLMLNNDMIGHTTQQDPDNWTIHLIEYDGAGNEADFARQVIQQYTNITPVTNSYNSPSSDSYPFWIRGYPPIFFIETEFNPYYHSPDDLFIHLNMDYAVETVRATAAIAALVNALPDMPEDFIVVDAGSGHELILEWSPVVSADIDYYEISVGLSSGDYSTSYTTGDTSFVLSGLEEGVTYYIGLSAVGTAGYASSIIENYGVPRSIPLTPVNFVDIPRTDQIDLSWSPNQEADLAGYIIYRSNEEGDWGEQIHTGLLTGTSFSDADVEPGILYYYSMVAVDDSSNESFPTDQLYSRMLSMDQGILIVADTPDGNGDFQNPTLASVTHFYNQILSDYSPPIYPLFSQERLKLADLAAYSTIVWHKNNISPRTYDNNIITAVELYLDAGGNILFSVYSPGKLLANREGYPQQYGEGDFMYDYLKVDEIYLHLSARFISALPEIDSYPLLEVDPEKAPAGLDFHIIGIESIQSVHPGVDIYGYYSSFPDGSSETIMNELPVGIEYIGDDYKLILLSFPLYRMYQQDAADLINYVMQEKFNETVEIEEITLPVSSEKFSLYANYPNPFNPETVIRFSLEQESEVNLTIYNLKGQKIKVIADGVRQAGEHFSTWNGRDGSNREMASGIYFYRLITDFGEDNKKMLLVK